MRKKTIKKQPCPNCGSLNTIKHGINTAGTNIIGCKDCKKQLVAPKIPLSELNCNDCGKLGINYRKPTNLCKNCYYARIRSKKKISEELINCIMQNNKFLSDYPNVNLDEFTMYLYVLKFRQKRNIELNKNTLLKYFNAYQKFIQNLSNDKAKEIETNTSAI